MRSHLFSPGSHTAALSNFALFGRTSQVYSEEAFHHVLSIERKRAQRSNTSFLLLLIRIKRDSGSAGDIPPALAAPLFSCLGLCFREVDFVGWHREGRVAGAVLAQGPVAPGANVLPRIVERVTQALSRRLQLNEQRLDVRVIRIGRGVA